MQTIENQAELLAAILPKPSGKIQANRFVATEDAAPCRGTCNGECAGGFA
ncbi:MAG: hypothetical protein WAW86_05600 [Gammaproteobacteria bacterium]